MARTSKTSKSKKKKKKSFSPILLLAIFSLVSLIALAPALDADFVYWDDDVNVYENPNIQSLSPENIQAIFTDDVIGNYNPLPIFTFALEHAAFGMNPQVMHFNNILLHILGVFMVYLIAFQLKINRWGSLLVALLFAIHPMRVESVAWITERKDVLFALFYWISLLWYIRSKRKGKHKFFWYALMIFPLALLSKIQAVSLPLSMLCVDYLRTGKIRWSDIIQKWPFFLLSLLTGLYGVIALREQGSIDPAETERLFHFGDRLIIGAYSYIIYLYKLIVPYPMAPMYPYPDGLKWFHYTIAAGILPLGGLLYWLWKKEYRIWLFGFAFFTMNVIFVLQIVGAGQGFLADRFTYVGYFGFFFISGHYFSKYRWDQKMWKWAVLSLLTLYMVLSFMQSQIWKNSDTMWSHVLKYNDQTPLPFGNRGNYFRDNGIRDKALQDYSSAIKLDGTRHSTYNSRGRLYFQSGELQKALADYNEALSLDPTNGEYYSNRGATYARLGNMQAALEDLNKSVQYKPDHAEAYLNRAITLDALGDPAAAANDLEQYLKLRPNDAEMWFNYAFFSFKANQNARAKGAIDQAIILNANNGKYYNTRAKIQIQSGNLQQARADAQKASQLGAPLEQSWLQRLNQ